MQSSKDFIVYNPIKAEFIFGNEGIKKSKLGLEKYLKISNGLIDSIREYLVKIIEVLLATCAHEGDGDEDIEFDEEEGGDETSFNIIIKNKV